MAERSTIGTTIQMPPELRQWLETRAAQETRSLSQQIIHLLMQQRAALETQAVTEAKTREVA